MGAIKNYDMTLVQRMTLFKYAEEMADALRDNYAGLDEDFHELELARNAHSLLNEIRVENGDPAK